jgi:hypothetical protein
MNVMNQINVPLGCVIENLRARRQGVSLHVEKQREELGGLWPYVSRVGVLISDQVSPVHVIVFIMIEKGKNIPTLRLLIHTEQGQGLYSVNPLYSSS